MEQDKAPGLLCRLDSILRERFRWRRLSLLCDEVFAVVLSAETRE